MRKRGKTGDGGHRTEDRERMTDEMMDEGRPSDALWAMEGRQRRCSRQVCSPQVFDL
jgi:hypothetical protein